MTAGRVLGEGSVSPAHGLVGKDTREPPFSPTEHGGALTTRFLSVSCDRHLRSWGDVGSAFCLQLGLHKGEARGEGRDSPRLLWAVLVVVVLWAHLSPALG